MSLTLPQGLPMPRERRSGRGDKLGSEEDKSALTRGPHTAVGCTATAIAIAIELHLTPNLPPRNTPKAFTNTSAIQTTLEKDFRCRIPSQGLQEQALQGIQRTPSASTTSQSGNISSVMTYKVQHPSPLVPHPRWGTGPRGATPRTS